MKSARLGRCVPFPAFSGPRGAFIYSVTLASVVDVPGHGDRADQDETDQEGPTSHRHDRHVSIRPQFQRAGRETRAAAVPSGLGHPSANPARIAGARGDSTQAVHEERTPARHRPTETHAARNIARGQQPQLRDEAIAAAATMKIFFITTSHTDPARQRHDEKARRERLTGDSVCLPPVSDAARLLARADHRRRRRVRELRSSGDFLPHGGCRYRTRCGHPAFHAISEWQFRPKPWAYRRGNAITSLGCKNSVANAPRL